MIRFLRLIIFLPINSICKIFLEIFIFNKQIRRILKGKLAKLYLKKYVKKAIKKDFANQAENIKSEETILWQYWEQGIDNAPEIVKACVESVEKFKNGNKHVILDKETVKNYIEIPKYIEKMNKKGIIKSAHYSDYIRTCLLEKYGGVWVDSTVLFTKDLPKFITNSEIFVLQNELRIDLDGLNMANYFIASKPHNILMQKMKFILEEYWKENNFVWNYFFYLHSFTLLTQMDKNIKKMFSKIPFISFIPVQRFQSEIMNKYDSERWNELKNISPIYKLSYKASVLNKSQKDTQDTFYEKLINRRLD